MKEQYMYSVLILFEYEIDGKTQKVTEEWLINAVSVTDAETKANVEIDKIAKSSGAIMSVRIKVVKETKIVRIIE